MSVARFRQGKKDGGIDRGGDHRIRLALQHGVADIELRLCSLIAFHGLQIILDTGFARLHP